MSILPKATILGKLQIIETYDYYDQPCLFSCKNQAGQIFIAIWVDKTETGDTWLYAPVSLNRFKAIRQGKTDLREIFADSEDAFVYKVNILYQADLQPIVEIVPCEQIQDRFLPEPGEIIETQGDVFAYDIEQ